MRIEQHFLTDPAKLAALALAAQIGPTDRVLELGSGAGTVAAALPPCELTLVELEPYLAKALSRFPHATVLQADALAVLRRLGADIILSNLPHTLTPHVLELLSYKTFRRALVAVHEQDDLSELANAARGRLELTPLLILENRDFTPPQPFRSRLLQVTRHPT